MGSLRSFFAKSSCTAAVGSLFSVPALAQNTPGFCEISLQYAPLSSLTPPAATAVPSLTMAGVGVLALVMGVAMWRNRKNHFANRYMSMAFMAGAAGLVMSGGTMIGSVIAAGPYEFSNPAGGTVSGTQIPNANPAPLIQVPNVSGTTMRITGNGNPAEAGTCTVGSDVADGAFCTAQAHSCGLARIDVASPPVIGCSSTQVAAYLSFETDPFQAGVYTRVYEPEIAPPPVFSNPAVPAPIFSSTLDTTNPIYVNDVLSNDDALSVSNYEITVTAPVGYGFGATLIPTMTWTGQQSCVTRDPVNT